MATLSQSALNVLEFVMNPDDVMHFLRSVRAVCVLSFYRARRSKLVFHKLLLKRVFGRKFCDVLVEQLEIDGIDVAHARGGFCEIRGDSPPTVKVNHLLRFIDGFWDEFSNNLSANEFRATCTVRCSESAWRHSLRDDSLRTIVPCLQILGLLQTRTGLNVVQREETARQHSKNIPRAHRHFVSVLIRLERDQRRKQDALTPRLS